MGVKEALTGPKKSARGKYTAVSVKEGSPTELDKRVKNIQNEEVAAGVASKIDSSKSQSQSLSTGQSVRDDMVNFSDGDNQVKAETVQAAAVERQKLEKPGGWKNVVDVMKIAVNPFSKEKLVASTGIKPVDKGIEVVANNPYTSAAVVAGTVQLVSGAVSAIAATTSKTAVESAGRIGTTGFYYGGSTGSVAGTIATNTATKKATASFLTKAVGAAKSPEFVVGALMATIGSYPFAGFIKEEALQTVGFGVKTALDNGDIDGAESAIELQESILDPGLWDDIKSKIPFVNVLSSLDDFYSAARLKLDIDKKVVSDLKIKQETGETDSEMYARIEKERIDRKEQERKDDEEYYAGIAQRKAEAKVAERAADEKYWNDILNSKDKETEKKESFDDDYWNEYYKTMAKVRSNSLPSNLKFGLL